MLDGAATDRDFGSPAGTSRTVDQDIGGRRCFRAHVRFDIAAIHLKVAHVAPQADDSALGVVTDVTSVNIDLVQIDIVQIDADTMVFVEMAVGDQHVAIALDQMDCMPGASDNQTSEGQLHRPGGFDAASLGMLAHDFKTIDERHPLAIPYLRFDRLGVGRTRMGPD